MSEARFEKAKASDFDFLIGAVHRYFTYDGIQFDHDRVPNGLRLILRDEDLGAVWLARLGEEVIGYAIVAYGFDLEFGGRLATLTDLFIDAPYRARGVGRRFLEHIEAFCRSRELGAIELQVETDNAEAIALYEKRGFVRPTRYLMSKRL